MIVLLARYKNADTNEKCEMTKKDGFPRLSANIVNFLRQEKGIEFYEIGQWAGGLTESFVNRVANGKNSFTCAHLERIAERLEMPLGLLVVSATPKEVVPEKKKQLHEHIQRLIQKSGFGGAAPEAKQDRGAGKIKEHQLVSAALKYRSQLHRVASRILKDHDAAEDVVQNAFVKLALSLRKKSIDEDNALPFLVAVVTRECYTYMKTSRRAELSKPLTEAVACVPDELAPEQLVMLAERAALMRDALNRLSNADRDILLMRYHLNMSYAKIAAKLNMPASATKSRARRALQKLSHVLGELLLEDNSADR